MSILGKLFSNETVLKGALSSVKSMMVENDIRYIVVQLDENGEVSPQLYKGEDQPRVMGMNELVKIDEVLLEQSRTIESLREANELLMDDNSKLQHGGGKLIAEYAEENAKLRDQLNSYRSQLSDDAGWFRDMIDKHGRDYTKWPNSAVATIPEPGNGFTNTLTPENGTNSRGL